MPSDCLGFWALIKGFSSALILLPTLSIRVLNSNSLKIAKSFSRSAGLRWRSEISTSTGTSVQIVARYLENRICSLFSSTFFLSAPLSSSVRSTRLSTLSKSLISLIAVFSPTPGHPGMLSILSPIKARRSITCEVRWIPYRSHTSFSPRISKSCPRYDGLYCRIEGLTS